MAPHVRSISAWLQVKRTPDAGTEHGTSGIGAGEHWTVEYRAASGFPQKTTRGGPGLTHHRTHHPAAQALKPGDQITGDSPTIAPKWRILLSGLRGARTRTSSGFARSRCGCVGCAEPDRQSMRPDRPFRILWAVADSPFVGANERSRSKGNVNGNGATSPCSEGTGVR
jgi:hypothetical protein